MVPGVTVDGNIININGNIVTLTLSWGEPFNNLDPIVSYTVSCSGDDTCPPNFTTTDNTTRSYTITNLTPMTNYTFSVVATNSIGSGEVGVVMITTPPGVATCAANTVTITATNTITISTTAAAATDTATNTTSSNVGMTTDTSKSMHINIDTTMHVFIRYGLVHNYTIRVYFSIPIAVRKLLGVQGFLVAIV